jgi:hypothetical protein
MSSAITPSTKLLAARVSSFEPLASKCIRSTASPAANFKGELASASATSPNAAKSAESYITDNAIIPLKERIVDEYYDPVMMLVRKIRGA